MIVQQAIGLLKTMSATPEMNQLLQKMAKISIIAITGLLHDNRNGISPATHVDVIIGMN